MFQLPAAAGHREGFQISGYQPFSCGCFTSTQVGLGRISAGCVWAVALLRRSHPARPKRGFHAGEGRGYEASGVQESMDRLALNLISAEDIARAPLDNSRLKDRHTQRILLGSNPRPMCAQICSDFLVSAFLATCCPSSLKWGRVGRVGAPRGSRRCV